MAGHLQTKALHFTSFACIIYMPVGHAASQQGHRYADQEDKSSPDHGGRQDQSLHRSQEEWHQNLGSRSVETAPGDELC